MTQPKLKQLGNMLDPNGYTVVQNRFQILESLGDNCRQYHNVTDSNLQSDNQCCSKNNKRVKPNKNTMGYPSNCSIVLENKHSLSNQDLVTNTDIHENSAGDLLQTDTLTHSC